MVFTYETFYPTVRRVHFDFNLPSQAVRSACARSYGSVSPLSDFCTSILFWIYTILTFQHITISSSRHSFVATLEGETFFLLSQSDQTSPQYSRTALFVIVGPITISWRMISSDEDCLSLPKLDIFTPIFIIRLTPRSLHILGNGTLPHFLPFHRSNVPRWSVAGFR